MLWQGSEINVNKRTKYSTRRNYSEARSRILRITDFDLLARHAPDAAIAQDLAADAFIHLPRREGTWSKYAYTSGPVFAIFR